MFIGGRGGRPKGANGTNGVATAARTRIKTIGIRAGRHAAFLPAFPPPALEWGKKSEYTNYIIVLKIYVFNDMISILPNQ